MPTIPSSPGTFGKPNEGHISINQPADVVTPLYSVSYVSGKASLKWNTNFKAKKTENYISAQKFIDSEVLKDCEPYVPFLTGVLVFTGITGTKIGSGRVSWIAPYARYQYYGKVVLQSPFGGGAIVTKRNLKYHGGGKRGAFWFERAKEVRKDAWVRGAAAIAARGRK